MPAASRRRPFEVRHLQLARAVFAAIAAVMITFSPDHSASVGLAVFSGWAIATGLVELLAAWLVYRPGDREWAGTRWSAVVLGLLTVVAGMVAGIVGLRSSALYFSVVIAWALVTGVFELAVSWRAARSRDGRVAAGESRDGVVVGAVTVLLGLGLLAVPIGYHLEYVIPAAGRAFTLTGIAIAVGVFGGYAAIVAIFLGIAGLSPRRAAAVPVSDASGPASTDASGLASTDASGRGSTDASGRGSTDASAPASTDAPAGMSAEGRA